mmetsp:Transcript_5305/g.8336  ORF Transcript_5305/g.8336 Transcript_5305/m.8336 type:complete len:337 (-) Transcript_5305:895-1905(-)
MNSPLPPPPTFISSPMAEHTPTRRRQAEPSNVDLLASFVNDDSGAGSAEDSKKHRHMYFEMGPLVISGAAIDRVRARFVSFTSKLTMDTLRPLPLFMGVTGPSFCFAADAFSPPISLSRQADKSSLEKLISRLSRNLNFFATNYAFMAMCTIMVVALMHPGMLLYVGITWSLWWLHVVVIRQDVRLVIMNRDLNDIFTPKRRSWILTAWTVWVALAKCLRPSMKGMAISGALVLFHALMRDPSKLAADVAAKLSFIVRDLHGNVVHEEAFLSSQCKGVDSSGSGSMNMFMMSSFKADNRITVNGTLAIDVAIQVLAKTELNSHRNPFGKNMLNLFQ